MNSCTRLYAHFMWSTWDRLPTITPELQAALYASISEQCRSLKAQPLEIGGVANHVHVLVRLPATVDVAQLAQAMKGGSSRLVNQLSPTRFAWQGAYAAFSICASEVAAVREYIRNQAEHHANETTDPDLEQPSE